MVIWSNSFTNHNHREVRYRYTGQKDNNMALKRGSLKNILPRDAKYLRAAPMGFNWVLYYSPRQRLYYKVTPLQGGFDIKTGTSIKGCCG
jgi:hypothetical protein